MYVRHSLFLKSQLINSLDNRLEALLYGNFCERRGVSYGDKLVDENEFTAFFF